MQRWGTSTLGGFAVLASLVALLALDCSGSGRADFANNDCTSTFCGPGRTQANSGPGGRAAVADAAVGSGGFQAVLGCETDPTSGLTLCRSVVSCPGFTLDVNAFPGCGLIAQTQGGIQLNCVCGGTQICPLGFAATCSDLTQLFSSTGVGVTNELCTQAISAGTCRTIGNVRTVGATCDRNCAAACGSAPTCVQACGC